MLGRVPAIYGFENIRSMGGEGRSTSRECAKRIGTQNRTEIRIEFIDLEQVKKRDVKKPILRWLAASLFLGALTTGRENMWDRVFDFLYRDELQTFFDPIWYLDQILHVLFW